MRHPPATGRALIVSFAGVAVAFSAGIGAAQLYSLRIRSAAREITGNSAPSLAHASSMRSTLRQLEVLVGDHVRACVDGSCTPEPARADALRRQLRDEWIAYRELPTFPTETERWPEVETALARLEENLSLTFGAVERGDARRADLRRRGPLTSSFDRVDDLIGAIAQFDHTEGQRVAEQIDALARQSVATSVVLDLVSVALTVLAAVLAIRLVRGQERILRERADELDQFAGRVAHDIKSPLATTSAALWVAGKDAGPRGLVAIERAQRAMNRVQRLVEGLLELARGGAVRDRGTSEVREVLDDVLAELAGAAESARVVVHTEPGETPPVACSPGVLTSVLSNLVRNAIVHMGGGEAREVWIRTRSVAERGVVRVEVEDTGPGIPASLGERVFEPFVRGPGTEVSDGTGLGLATAKRIVDAHAGRIGFHPGAGRGTVFWFELPAAPNGVAAAPPAPVRAS